MESPFEVEIQVDVEVEFSSPPTEDYDPYPLEISSVIPVLSSQWQTREGHDEGDIASDTSALYPNFTSTSRRQVFCIATYRSVSFTSVTWNGETFTMGRLWLNTDNGWASSGVVIASGGEGYWFACEGELEQDFGKWKPAVSEPFSL